MGDMNWSIWGKKLIIGALISALVTFLTYIAGVIDITEFPAEWAGLVAVVYTIIIQIANWIKHTWLT